MDIDRLIADESKSSYVNRVERTLNNRGLTFTDLKNYIRVGSSIHGITDAAFNSYFGDDADIPIRKNHCLCDHEIIEQCYLCPEGSKNIDDVITVGNKCIRKWGYDPAVRGNGTKFTCEFCGSTLNKSGKTRHQQTNKCRSRRDTASDISTSVGFESMD